MRTCTVARHFVWARVLAIWFDSSCCRHGQRMPAWHGMGERIRARPSLGLFWRPRPEPGSKRGRSCREGGARVSGDLW